MAEAFDGMDWNTRIERAGSTRPMNALQNKTIMIYDANAFLNHAPGAIGPLSPAAGKQIAPATKSRVHPVNVSLAETTPVNRHRLRLEIQPNQPMK